MVNKVAGYYTTDQKYRNVGSNHLSKISYNPSSLELFIEFYNGAKYRYLGVPKGLYDGMMTSPSHGVFFYENIRQRFPYELIQEFPSNSTEFYKNPNNSKKIVQDPKKSELLNSILPENKKLDLLDRQQQELDNMLRTGRITQQEANKYKAIIEAKKESLLAKLEKIGYFQEPDQELDKELDIELDTDPKTLWNSIRNWITNPNTIHTTKAIAIGLWEKIYTIAELTFIALKFFVKGYIAIMLATFAIMAALMS